LEVGDGVEVAQEEWEKGTNAIVNRTDLAIMIVVNNNVLMTVHI